MDKRTELISLAQGLLADGLVVRTWGNFSLRTEPGRFIITPSGRHYATMKADDLTDVGWDGQWTGPYKPSSEHPMHALVYEKFDEAGCVLHTHQPYASALSLSPKDIILNEAQASKLGQAILPVADYALPSTHGLHVNVGATLDRTGAQVILLASHGALIWARTSAEAHALGNALEEVAREIYEIRVGHAPSPKLNEIVSERTPAGIRFSVNGTAVTPDEATWANHMKIYAERKDTNAIVTCADSEAVTFCGSVLKPYLDDFAQIAGIKADSSTKHQVCLASNIAYCQGPDLAGATDVRLVLTKNARAARFGQAVGAKPIKAWECLLMNLIYRFKYSKQAK